MSTLAFLLIVLAGAAVLFALAFSGKPKGRSKGRPSSNRGSLPALSRDDVYIRWQTITSMAAGGGNGLRQAIGEADKLLDHVMRQQGAAGETMADRLRSFGARFNDRDSTWRAHKLRNALAHEVGFDLVPSQAKEALAAYEQALKDLGVI